MRNADWYFLTELIVYADGAISCNGDTTDLDGLANWCAPAGLR